MSYRLGVVYAFDPQSARIGGIETYVRDVLRNLPDDFTYLLIGIDEFGTRPLGQVSRETYGNKTFDFLPVVHFPDAGATGAAKRLKDSINLQFMRGLVRYWPRIRKLVRAQPISLDLQRVEFAGYARSLGVPFTQTMHTVGVPQLPMDSLLRKYRGVHQINEWIAARVCDRFLCVNPLITERVRQSHPSQAHKIETQSTWVDTGVFKPSPYLEDGFGIAFAGRLDLFKSPSLMFKTMARVRSKLGEGVRFHYIGPSDPDVFPEFAAIRDITIRHGFQNSAGVAQILRTVHAGILTSEFEGMPIAVLEVLGSGRPVGAIHLPQLEAVIKPGLSGHLVARSTGSDDMAERLADAFVEIHRGIKTGLLQPERVATAISNYTAHHQIKRIYDRHRTLQDGQYRRTGTVLA
jgi:glycosyltransferase involved in cell wall biosynthesis